MEDRAQRQGGAPLCCHVQPSHTCAQAAACLGGSGWGGALGGSGLLLRGFWGEGVCLSLEKNGVGPQLLPRQSPAKDRCGRVRTEPPAPVAVEGGKLAWRGGGGSYRRALLQEAAPKIPPKSTSPGPKCGQRGPPLSPLFSSAGTCLLKFQCSEATHTAGPASWVCATCLVRPCRTTIVPLHGGGGRLCSSPEPSARNWGAGPVRSAPARQPRRPPVGGLPQPGPGLPLPGAWRPVAVPMPPVRMCTQEASPHAGAAGAASRE